MDYYNCLRNQLNCEYAFCNQGICIKKMQEATHKSKKLLKKKTWISTERLITVSIFIWRMQPVLQQLLHMDTMQRLSALALHF